MSQSKDKPSISRWYSNEKGKGYLEESNPVLQLESYTSPGVTWYSSREILRGINNGIRK